MSHSGKHWATPQKKRHQAKVKRDCCLLLLGENNKNPWARDHPKLAIENA